MSETVIEIISIWHAENTEEKTDTTQYNTIPDNCQMHNTNEQKKKKTQLQQIIASVSLI